MKEKRDLWIVLSIAGVMTVASLAVILIDMIFMASCKQTKAVVISIDSIPAPKPYLITFEYFNIYQQKNFRKTITKIEGGFFKDWHKSVGSEIDVVYGKLFPDRVFIKGYREPNVGVIVFLSLVFTVLLFADYLFVGRLNELLKTKRKKLAS